MSNITLPAALASAKVDTYARTSGTDTVHVQAMAIANPVDPVSGSIGANGATVTVTDLYDMDGVLIRTAGTFSGTIAFEVSNDGANWYSLYMVRGSSGTGEASRALTGTTLESWRANISGWGQVRVRCTAYTSGTAAIAIAPVNMAFEPAAVSSVTVGGSVTATLAASANLAADVASGVRTTATNALSRTKVVSAASTNATLVKASAGRVYGWWFANTTASWRFVKLFNKASAPVPGTDIPVDVIAVPPNSSIDVQSEIGWAYTTGIGLSVTAAFADLDATAVAAGDVLGGLLWA